MRPFGRRCLVTAGLALALLAPAAGAEERIEAGPPNRYLTEEVTIAQGERLMFRNNDVATHDVTAEALGPDGKPLFSTPLIERGEEAFVEGSQYLTTGTYAYRCSVHPQMKGTLRVSAEGTPVPRPAPGTAPAADDRAPRVSVRILNRRLDVAARGGLLVRLRVDEAAVVRLTAVSRLRPGGPLVPVARLTARIPAAGVRRVALRLTPAGRRAFSSRRRLAVLVRARAADASDNRTLGVTGRELRG